MRAQGIMFIGVAIFFAVADIIYWWYSHDPVGTTALTFSIAMALLVGYYLLYTQRQVPAKELYEDNADADVEEGAGEIGFYPPHSWWPLALGLSGAVAFIGIPVGWWLFIIGLAFGVVSVYGWVYEYYRGEYRH